MLHVCFQLPESYLYAINVGNTYDFLSFLCFLWDERLRLRLRLLLPDLKRKRHTLATSIAENYQSVTFTSLTE